MSDYEQRLQEELFSLSDKIQKLDMFISSEAYDKLSVKEQDLLFDQSNVMQDYANILNDRIHLLKETK